ncbi:MAG: metallophosphoesterase [Clostridia bacterium]|nr:metallophosphoesterase [Clostridia bacterium]
MKILHTSDIHIDSPMTSRLPAAKIRERRRELLLGFDDLARAAVTEGCQAMIIAGDLFDSEEVSKRALDTVLGVIERYPSLIFFYLKGNHEGDALAGHSVLPNNLLIFGEDWTYFCADGLTVAGRSICSDDMFDTLELPSDTKNIVVLHGELRDRSAFPDIIGRSDAAGKNIDYMALGHYHTYSAEPIGEDGLAVYSGTPEGRGFDEVGDMGYVVIDTEGKLTHRFVSFAKRKMQIIKVDITGLTRGQDITELVKTKLSDVNPSDIVRVELVGKYVTGLWKDTEAIRERFEGGFYYLEVKDSSKIEIDPDSYKNDRSLKGEFIRLVTADESLSDEQKERIVACGIYALMGDNIYDR